MGYRESLRLRRRWGGVLVSNDDSRVGLCGTGVEATVRRYGRSLGEVGYPLDGDNE